jgi:ribosomal protein L19
MKFAVPLLKVGDRVHVRVEEILDQREIMISYAGDLLRVQNETARQLRVGDFVEVIVAGQHPLRFQLFAGMRSLRRNGHLDVSV